jgi:hypothetical protein
MMRADARFAVFVLIAALLFPASSSAQTKPAAAVAPPSPAQLTREQMRDFLRTAEVVSFKEIGKGVTRPKRLTLRKDGLTHDAAFQSVDEQQVSKSLGGGGRPIVTELNFVDAYRYNLAADALAVMLGLGHMMPVHVERRWRGNMGSLSWWVETLMDEGERLEKNIAPPNSHDWNNQMYRMRVFAALIHDTDRNLGNVLITPAWKVMMIDFTRAFRRQTELIYGKDLARIDKALLAAIERLTRDSIKKAVGHYLTGGEIDSVLGRRNRLVTHFSDLVAQKGAAAVLY